MLERTIQTAKQLFSNTASKNTRKCQVLQRSLLSGHQRTKDWTKPPAAFPIQHQAAAGGSVFQSLQIYPGLNLQARSEMTLYLPIPPNMCQFFFTACFFNLSFAKQKESKEARVLLSFHFVFKT